MSFITKRALSTLIPPKVRTAAHRTIDCGTNNNL